MLGVMSTTCIVLWCRLKGQQSYLVLLDHMIIHGEGCASERHMHSRSVMTFKSSQSVRCPGPKFELAKKHSGRLEAGR